MFKLFTVAIVCALVVAASAKPLSEDEEVQSAMRHARDQGLARFGGAIRQEQEEASKAQGSQPSKVFSEYTKDIKALGGGRPLLREQYINHHYTPLAPSVLPRNFNVAGDKMTAAEAAKIIVPSRPLQFTVDHQH